jgi:trigger factor
MSFEVLPQVTITDLSALKLERPVADVEDAQIDKAIGELAERSTTFVAEDDRVAVDGDRLTINFVGKIDDVAFDGGTGDGVTLVLGKDGFIPGFAEGLKGAKAGDERKVEATFPDDYPVDTLKGKLAIFDVTVTEVAKPVVPTVDDAFAKTLGAEDLPKLRELVTGQIQREHDQASRGKVKRQLLDMLEKAHEFPLPPSLVEGEFDAIWKQVQQGLEQNKRTFEDEGKTEEQARDEYRKIAERRVRLGLVVGEIGDKNKIEVSQEDLRRALMEQARRLPGQEQMVFEYYQKNPQAMAELRAPLFEEKVVDFILELARPDERKVSREELFKQDDE